VLSDKIKNLPVSIPDSPACFLPRPIRYRPHPHSGVHLLHQHQTTEKMKATTIILAALFTFQVSVLFAGNESTTVTSATVETTLDMTALIPVTPAEATFEEVNSEVIDFTALVPATPMVADFE
jgi:hypothetical protein